MRWIIGMTLMLALLCATRAAADTYSITFDEELRSQPATGRVILFFITETGPHWAYRSPMNGPFYESPQPIASVAVEDWQPGQPVLIDASAFAFPKPLDQLHGRVRVQAVLDLSDNPERSHEDGPGNLFSEPLSIAVSAEEEEHFWIELVHRVEPRKLPSEQENLRWIELRSEMLSAFYGRDVYHRAGVALPMGYLDEESSRSEWPALYVIPGFGGREEAAVVYAGLFRSGAPAGDDRGMPQAVVIVLDPESPLGHHGFTDSPNHGARGTALVEEFIPYLESELKLAARQEGRLLTGHSSGGWTSLWLQINWPNVFGGCWASAPDPIDFSAFQRTNLYEDENLYFTADGEAVASYRVLREGEETVAMTVREECLMEHAIHPRGGSGQQWDAWMAMFSPKDEATGSPARLCDPMTGRIDRAIAEHWQRFDIARLVLRDWQRYGTIVTNRIRLVCGARDSFYLERAVEKFKAQVEQRAGEELIEGSGYIAIIEGADHDTVKLHTQPRWNTEMRKHLRRNGLHD